jgi:hypothetical protein
MKTILFEFLVHASNNYFDDPSELIRMVAYAEDEAAARASLRWELWELQERGYEVHKVTLLHQEVINVRLED